MLPNPFLNPRKLKGDMKRAYKRLRKTARKARKQRRTADLLPAVSFG